jgi:hypothetical protein
LLIATDDIADGIAKGTLEAATEGTTNVILEAATDGVNNVS